MLFLAVNLSAFLCFGQKGMQVSPNQTQISRKNFSNWALPVKFYERLNPVNTVSLLKHNKKSTNIQNITVDTVVVNSYYENPKRYIYTYSSSGYLTVTLVQDNNNNAWENTTMDVRVYDSLGNKLVSIWENWQDSVWVNSAKNQYTYGPDRTLLTSHGKIWNNGKWENSDSTSYTYDIYGHLLATYKEVWNDSTWINDVFEIAIYDSLGNMLNLTRNTWDDSLGWLKNQQYDYTYDTNQNVLSATIKNGVNFKWQNFYKEIYTYDSANNKLSYVGQLWKEADSIWVNSEKYLYTYNSISRLTNALGQNWDTTSASWVNYVNAQYTHDLYGGIESDYIQRWNDRIWADSALTQYVYDKFGDAIRGDYYISGGTGWAINGDGPLQISYNYNLNQQYFVGYHIEARYTTPSAEGIKNIDNPVSRFACVPNPATSISNIQFDLKKKTNLELSIVSLTGQKISTIYRGSLLKGTYRYPLSMGGFPAGIYFATITTPDFVRSIKIIWMN